MLPPCLGGFYTDWRYGLVLSVSYNFSLCTPLLSGCQATKGADAHLHYGGSPRSQLIKQDWYKYCSVLRTFRPSPRFFWYIDFLWHLFDRYFNWINIFDKYIFDIDLRNSKNPTYTHIHTPPTKPLYPPVSSSSANAKRASDTKQS